MIPLRWSDQNPLKVLIRVHSCPFVAQWFCMHRAEIPTAEGKPVGHEWTRMHTNKKERLNEVKGKSAIDCSAVRQNAWNSAASLWARRYTASTAGFTVEQSVKYIREQEAADGTNGQF